MAKPHDLLIGILAVILIVAIALIIVTYSTLSPIASTTTGQVIGDPRDPPQGMMERREIILPDQERSTRQPYISYPEGTATKPIAPHVPATALNTQREPSTTTSSHQAYPSPQYLPQQPSASISQDRAMPPQMHTRLPVQIISDFTAQQFYNDARRLIQYSPCYQELADLRLATLQTGLSGTKFVGPLIPDESYTQFSGVIVVQMRKSHYVVFHDEIPVLADLSSGQVYCPTPVSSAMTGGHP